MLRSLSKKRIFTYSSLHGLGYIAITTRPQELILTPNSGVQRQLARHGKIPVSCLPGDELLSREPQDLVSMGNLRPVGGDDLSQ